MNTKLGNAIWGLILIGAGALFLVQQAFGIGPFSPLVWAAVFAGASLLFFIVYFANGVRNWGWLFPACTFAGLAVTVFLSTRTSEAIVGAPLLASIAIPFVVVFAMDVRKHWWALIPAGVMLFVTLATVLADRAAGEVIGAVLFFMIALAFLVVFLLDQTRRWALLVAYILGALGLMPLMAMSGRPELAGSLVMFAIALPFFVVYFRGPEKWWAIIPAGIVGTTGVVILAVLALNLPGEGSGIAIPNALMFAGVAATFAVVWLRHARHWAMWVTGLAALAAAAALLLGSQFESFWPLLLIALGLLLMFNTLRRKPVA